MACTCVVGLQWGDEAKGKIVDLLTEQHDLVVRYNGVVMYPPRFLEEVENLRRAGIGIGPNLAVSDHAHVIFPYHMEEERLSEQTSGEAIGTTGRGIGPCYQDKVGRVCGVRLGELLY